MILFKIKTSSTKKKKKVLLIITKFYHHHQSNQMFLTQRVVAPVQSGAMNFSESEVSDVTVK